MRYNFKKIAKVAFLAVAGLLLVGYAAIQQWPANQILSYGVLPLIQYFDINGEIVLKAHNAVGTCADLANGVGCTDDTAAVQAAWKAACGTLISGSYACTKRIHATSGVYYFPNGLQTNAGNIVGGGANSVLSPYWYGDGRGGSGPTIFLIGNGAPSIGWDNFGTAGFRMDGIRVQTLTSATTNPKFLVGWGKTNNCNCDVGHINDSDFYDYATSNKSVLFNLGTENFWVDYSSIYAFGGGHGVTFSAINTLGAVPTGVTINAGQALQPVSMTQSGIAHSVINTNGGLVIGSPLTMAVYLDPGTTAIGVNADNFYDNDIQLNGYNDVGFSDGKIDTATTLMTAIQGRNNMIECFSATCGAVSTEQAFKFGSITKDFEFTGTNFTKSAETDLRVNDAVTNGTTTVTSATYNCSTLPAAAMGYAAVITDANGNGTQPGSHVKTCVGNGPATITLDIATTGAGAGGLTLDVVPPDMQLYAAHTNDIFTGRGPGNFECPSGLGSIIGWSLTGGSPGAASYCAGATENLQSNGTLRINETNNTAGAQGLLIRRYQDSSPLGHALDVTNAAGTSNLCDFDFLGNISCKTIQASGNLLVSGDFTDQTTPPTLTAGCNGAGSIAPAGAGIFTMTTQTAASTTCTVTKAGAACPSTYTCMWSDGGNATPAAFAAGAETNLTAVVNYVSGANIKIRGFCSCR